MAIKQNVILFLLDEIMTVFARLFIWFAMEAKQTFDVFIFVENPLSASSLALKYRENERILCL
jgi:hypothetical protein